MSEVSPNSGVMLAAEMGPPQVALSEEDREALKRAVEALEAPSFAALSISMRADISQCGPLWLGR